MHILDKKYSSPLEREYEAWIIRGIEDYFHVLGEKVSIWAVSPSEEVRWPADEHMVVGRRLIGLQLKKVDYIDSRNSVEMMGRLRWTFHNPPGQYNLVVNFPEIFYCLPTFISRDYRRHAIHHCVFWRPTPNGKHDLNAWYDNPSARTPHKSIGVAPRWGRFLEEIFDCKIGKQINSMEHAKSYIQSIVRFMEQPGDFDESGEDGSTALQAQQPNENSVYFFSLPSRPFES